MLPSSNSSSNLNRSSPPEPPPKQRNNLDPTAIDNRKIEPLPQHKQQTSTSGKDDLAPIEDFTKPPSDPVLFEPPTNGEPANKDSAQRYKKGQLRLIKAPDGGWKLEEIEEQQRKQQQQQDQRAMQQEQREQEAVSLC